ncbi:dihydrodipicolinate synthase [Bordetella sp. H567]|uniref:4-hydroxy-tetrahydrodipicolinate synthase n=1 Tax=Bordetella sp. H567 TaxID=1697043 RepID=UPI00081D15C1|nr:4-hydroxy-tetrahydrodipicolinate synthase [Bordetella sp. H567]AOB33130.1 dihydrodipicolinate synthase [Bordetella sp. H567]
MDTPNLATQPLPPSAAQRAPAFRGIWVPLVTPFRHGEVDPGALRRLVRHYRDAGVHGLVACGSTGEAAALDAGEQLLVLDTVLSAADGLPVAMGLSSNHLGQARDRLREFGQRPLAGVLASAPAYVRPAQDGLRLWFETLADASRVPLVLYDIPYRTGATVETSTLLALASHPNIVAIKDCGGALDKTIALIADGRLAVMAGEDLQALATLGLGGAGAIVASAHVRPDLHVAMFDAARAGSWDRARALFHALAPVIRLLYAHPNPGPVKAVLAALHDCEDMLRAPMTAAGPELRAALAAAIAALPPACK